MHLLMWRKGGKHLHARGKGGKQNAIDTSADRLIFYDGTGSTAFDAAAGKWYRDGQPFTPTFPLTFKLTDGRIVTVDKSGKGKGGKLTWRVQ